MSGASNAWDELGLDRVDTAALAWLLHSLDEIFLLLVGEGVLAFDFAAAAALDAADIVRMRRRQLKETSTYFGGTWVLALRAKRSGLLLSEVSE